MDRYEKTALLFVDEHVGFFKDACTVLNGNKRQSRDYLLAELEDKVALVYLDALKNLPEKYGNIAKEQFVHKYGELYLNHCIAFQEANGYM